jgi:hypothetical protein
MLIDLLGQATIEVTEDAADAVIAELDALGAADAVERSAPDRLTLTVTNENATVILRALDHVRNAGNSHRATQDARDSLLRYLALSPLTYKLRSWEFGGGEERAFWSYTGTYEETDRIVDAQGRVYEVIRVERQATPLKDGVLLVQTVRSG